MDVNRLSVDGKQHSPCSHAQEHEPVTQRTSHGSDIG
jgi:hypothetical protein